jgi:hypothetical protein
MLSDHEDALARAAFAPVRDIEPDEDLVARVVARVGRRKKASSRFALGPGRPRLALQALAALALLGVALYSVPATRAAIEGTGASVGGVFSGWIGGDSSEAPGKPLEATETMPEYLEYLDDPHQAKEPRVIAEAGGYKLYSYIGSSGGLNFELGDTGFGMGFESAAELGDAPLYVLGRGAMKHPDAQGHVPLFGIASRSVTSVELTYESGPPLRVSGVDGGFVLLAEPSRGPTEVIAFDASGKEIDREPINYPLLPVHEGPPPGSRIERSGQASSGSQEP